MGGPAASDKTQAQDGSGLVSGASDYGYDATNKRDPFRSFVLDEARGRFPELRAFAQQFLGVVTQQAFTGGIQITDSSCGGEQTDDIRDVFSKLAKILFPALGGSFGFPAGGTLPAGPAGMTA